MPNHYHLIVKLQSNDFSTKIMQPFTVSYTKSINKRLNRVGPLFQGPFQAILINEDSYLTYLTSYIHLNPVIAGLAENPEDWEYSSYQDFIGLRDTTLSKPDIILEQFTSRNAYADFVISSCDPTLSIPSELLFDG
jgi:hypothetical protein